MVIGLIAGWGRFPALIAQEARRRGVRVVALGIEGITDPTLASEVDDLHIFKLGQLERAIQTFKEAGVSRAVMAGRVQHVNIFGGFVPDWRAVKVLARLQDRRADTILREVAAEFAKDGIELQNSAAYLSDHIPGAGTLTQRKPSPADKEDIELGWRVAKAVAAQDVGQTVVVRRGAVLAVEAMEGTDDCIRRAGAIARAGGLDPDLVVVKVAKPQQDLRFDLPVFGLDSLTTFQEAGVRTLAVEAGRTLLLDQGRFLEEADRLGVAVCAVQG